MASEALIGTEVGSYRITSALGTGGMGAVYLGVHPLIGKRVAIKVLHAEFADKPDVVGRFFNEARAVSVLRHPNIVELIDFGKMDLPTGEPLHYCIMELLDGETLRDRIKRGGAMPEAQAIHIAGQICDAVAAAHRQQIIHRDLKPENVFLVGPQRNIVKILDFGIAKLHDQGAASVQTQAGVLLGTPSYMSPEQCMGRPVDRRTDVYATGIILFEMCTGRVPFIGEGYADLLIKQISADVPSPRSINPALTPGIEKVIARALEKDPAGRFQSMEEFELALQAPSQLAGPTPQLAKVGPGDSTIVSTGNDIVTTLQGSAGEIGELTVVPQRNQRKSGGSGAIIAGVLGVLLVGGGGAAYFLLKTPSTPVADSPIKPDPAPTAQEKKFTKLHFTTEPDGATVTRKDTGDVLGTTPLDKDVPADGTLVNLVVRKDGFKEQTVGVLLSDRTVTRSLHLVSDAPVETKKEPEKRKRKKDKLPTLPGSEGLLAPNLGDDE